MPRIEPGAAGSRSKIVSVILDDYTSKPNISYLL